MKITRETELRGAQLSASSGREHISYNARFLRGDEAFVGSVLADTVADPLLQEWIVSKQQSRVAADLAAADSTVGAYRICFRTVSDPFMKLSSMMHIGLPSAIPLLAALLSAVPLRYVFK